jgi:hypothetical protein
VVAVNTGATPTDFQTLRPGAVVYSTKARGRGDGFEPESGRFHVVTLTPEEAVVIRLDHGEPGTSA